MPAVRLGRWAVVLWVLGKWGFREVVVEVVAVEHCSGLNN